MVCTTSVGIKNKTCRINEHEKIGWQNLQNVMSYLQWPKSLLPRASNSWPPILVSPKRWSHLKTGPLIIPRFLVVLEVHCSHQTILKNETTPHTSCWQPESGIKHVLFILPVVINREIAKVTKDQYNQPIAKVMSPSTLALLCNLSSLQDVRHKIEDYLQNLQNGIWLVLLLHPLLVYCISSLTLNKTIVDIHGNS